MWSSGVVEFQIWNLACNPGSFYGDSPAKPQLCERAIYHALCTACRGLPGIEFPRLLNWERGLLSPCASPEV